MPCQLPQQASQLLLQPLRRPQQQPLLPMSPKPHLLPHPRLPRPLQQSFPQPPFKSLKASPVRPRKPPQP
jgi:hypothetical protein